MELEEWFAIGLSVFVISAFLGLSKHLLKLTLAISPFALLAAYLLILDDTYNNINDLKKFLNSAQQWEKSEGNLINQNDLFISGKLNADVLINTDFGVNVQGQYLVKKVQVRRERSYQCGTNDKKKTCYEMFWVTERKKEYFLEQYFLDGAEIDRSVINAIVKSMPLEDVFIDLYPPTYLRGENTLFPTLEGKQLVYKKDKAYKDIGDIRIRFLKINYSEMSLLGKVEGPHVELLHLSHKPLMLMYKITFDKFSDFYQTENIHSWVFFTVLFLFLGYLIWTVCYFTFLLPLHLLKSQKRKVIYFISPFVIVCILNLIYLF